LSGTASLAPGSHAFEIVGTSTPSAIERRSPATLEVYDVAPAAPGLTAPADNALDVPLQPTLSWTPVPQAAHYVVEVAADPAFSTIVYTQTSSDNQHMLDTGLEPETAYWWRAQAQNSCGTGPWSTIYSFTTRAVPPLLLVDDDDNAPDVRAAYTAALDNLGLAYDVWDTQNSDNEPNAIELGPYSTVIWFTGDEFGGAAGPGSAGESALTDWQTNPSRCLLMSAQDYFYDRGLTAYMGSALGVASVDNDVNQTTVTGSGPIFGGLGPYTLSYPFNNYSDEILPAPGAETAFTGNQGPAAVTKQTLTSLTSFWGFPLEAIPSPADREAALSAFFAACAQLGIPIFTDGFETGDESRWSETTL
jgi:hypothetical protein